MADFQSQFTAAEIEATIAKSISTQSIKTISVDTTNNFTDEAVGIRIPSKSNGTSGTEVIFIEGWVSVNVYGGTEHGFISGWIKVGSVLTGVTDGFGTIETSYDNGDMIINIPMNAVGNDNQIQNGELSISAPMNSNLDAQSASAYIIDASTLGA